MKTKNCLQCGIQIIKSQNESLKNWETRRKHCSRECVNLYKKGKSTTNSGQFKKGESKVIPSEKRARGEKNPKWKGGQVTKSCITCSKEFKVDPYLKDKLKNCSKACSNVYRASPEARLESSKRARQQVLSQYGETPEFITKLSKIIRESAKYRLWREQVWKRDNYTCQMCLKQKGKICADHIVSFLEVILSEDIDSYDKAMGSGVLWDTSNGRTLCYDCH